MAWCPDAKDERNRRRVRAGLSLCNVSSVVGGKGYDKVHRLVKPRGPYRKPDDDGLLELVRRLLDERPTYGYRRITALTNRERAKTGEPAVNQKRVFGIMRQSMLLARHTGRRTGRVHDGKVIVMRSSLRW
ncbi:IS3 family transposase [Mesorhizobium intechi]|nr:IS3 family transposase [Mesorhizobium intechi]